MAKIWPVYDGTEPTSGGPWPGLPLPEAIKLFELRPADFVSDLATTPRFGNVQADLRFAGPKHVVVEIDSGEGQVHQWRPGFYVSPVGPDVAFRRLKEAYSRLIRRVLVLELGEENVIRVEHQPTADSQGRDALEITVVLAADATRRVRGEAVLNALVRLQDQLRTMGDHRTPIVHYATEAELKEDVGP